MRIWKKYFTIAAILFGAIQLTANAQNDCVFGLDGDFVFSAKKCGNAAKSLSFNISGKPFKVLTFYYEGSTLTAVEDASGKRKVLFMNGKPNMATSSGCSYPKIGFENGKELETNEYTIGHHDFTNDGQDELVVIVKSADNDGFAVYIFGFTGADWKCIGEMVTAGHDIRFCRIFRQTVTLKDGASSVLYTWTWHDGRFDFLSSDKVNDFTVLY